MNTEKRNAPAANRGASRTEQTKDTDVNNIGADQEKRNRTQHIWVGNACYLKGYEPGGPHHDPDDDCDADEDDGDDDAWEANPGPAAQGADPLAGFRRLRSIATVGARQIREFAARPITWAWKDFAVAGSIVVIAGPSAEGKTTLLFLLLMARATTGGPLQLCGRSVSPARPGQYVVLIEAEHGDTSTCRKLVKSASLMGAGDGALDRVIALSRKAVTLGSPEWREVEALIAAGRVSDIAIDTLARVAPSDANSEQDQVKAFETIARAIEKAPAIAARPTAWILAHTRKGEASTLEDVGGSMQRVAQADTVIMVKAERAESGQVIAATVKLLKPREEPTEWPEASRLAICGDRIEWSAAAAGKAGHGQGEALESRILSVLAAAAPTAWLTAQKLRDELEAENGKGASGKAVRGALERLVAAGQVRTQRVRPPRSAEVDGYQLMRTASSAAA